jgi:3-oxoacyl-[acyl-carrier protein] reductase
MGLLDGCTALVTGAGRGIGRAMVEAFAREGASVAAAARTGDEIESVCATVRAEGGKAVPVRVDLKCEDSIKACVEHTRREFGRIDIVVNNAGVIALRQIIDTPTEVWDDLMSTNVRGVFLLCREVLPEMIGRGSGRIINVGSAAGRRGYKEQGVYCSSKHALAGLTKVLAAETQQHGIRVHLLSPGGVLTGLSSELRASRGEAEDSPEWMTSEEVAQAALYLCSQTGAAFTDELMLRRYAAEPWR